MFYIFITVFAIARFTSADESCSEDLGDVCSPDFEPFFPENEEDLVKFCDVIIKGLECEVAYEERCHTQEDFFPGANRVLATFHEICNPDTLLNAAIRENIKCVSESIQDVARQCYVTSPSAVTLEKQAEELFKDFEELNDNDKNEENLEICLNKLNQVACQAILSGKKCGTVAKGAFIEVVRKLSPFDSCTEEAIQKLPTIVRLRELENVVEEALERKKK